MFLLSGSLYEATDIFMVESLKLMDYHQNVMQNIQARFFFHNYIFEKMTCSLAASM